VISLPLLIAFAARAPPDRESPTRFEPTLNAGTLASLLAALRLRRVNLLMPKLHLHTQTSLNAPLESLA